MHKLLIDIPHFVRKDAKNWDEYVPYADTAYQAMPLRILGCCVCVFYHTTKRGPFCSGIKKYKSQLSAENIIPA